MTELLATIAENLRVLRARKNIRQEDVAKGIGTTTANISRYEQGLQEPSLATIVKLADFFGVTVDSLRYRSE